MRNSVNHSNLTSLLRKSFCQMFALICLSFAVQAQDYDNPETIITEAQGYQLKMKHIVAYMGLKMAMNQMPQNPTEAQTEAVAAEAVMVFNANPAATIQQLEAVAQELGLNGGKGAVPLNGSPPQKAYPTSQPASSSASSIGGAFNMEAEMAKFGPNQLDFHSQTANQLRQLLLGTKLTDSSNSFSSSYGSSHYSSSSSNIHFCANGTFSWISDAHISVDTPGAYANSGSGDPDAVTGYWDVATGGGMTFIMLYSRHPEMLQLNPNGFIPMPVNKFQADLVAVPNQNSKRGEDLYRVNRGQAQCY